MTNRAKLPGLPRVATQDQALNRWITAVAERLEVREGSRGDPGERAVTVRELQALTKNAVQVVGGQLVSSGALDGKDPMADANFVARLEESIRNTRLYQNLLKRLDDPRRFDSLAAEVRQALAGSIAQEALRLGADIRRVEAKIQDSDRSLALAVEELTAAVGVSAAGIREVKSAFATAERAQAVKVTQLEASLGNYYQDGAEGRASLEETLTTTVDKVEGISSEYMIKVAVGSDGKKKVAGFGLSATEDPEGAQDSAFIVLADKFAVVTPGDALIDPKNPPANRIPFGVDASGVFINGALRINAGGRTLADLESDGNYSDYVFIRSASAPGTPTATTGIPANWSDTPPTGTAPLYMSKATKKADGTVVGSWSTPARLDGMPGAEGKYTEVQYAVGSSATTAPTFGWQATPPAISSGQFLWMQSRVVTPPAAAPAWGAAVRISGEKGDQGQTGAQGPQGPQGPIGQAGAAGQRGAAFATSTAASPSDSAFTAASGLSPVLVGDQLMLTNSSGSTIYTRQSWGWANTTALQVHGDAVIAGTLVANTVSTGKVIIRPIGSRSGSLAVTNGVGFIAFNTSSVVATPLWSYAVDPPSGVHVSVLWYYNTDTTVWFQVHASNFSGGPYSGTIGTVKIWMF